MENPRIDNSLEFMRPVLEKWIEINQKYVNEFENKDTLYWYNERANVGTLAAAIWKSNGMAIEEYNDEKRLGGEKWQGRVDLFYKYNEKEIISEAKILWLDYPTELNYINAIKYQLQSANDATRCSTTPYGNKYEGIGILFIVPYWKERNSKEQFLNNLEHDINEVLNLESNCFAAYYKNEGKDIISPLNYVCNAVYLIGKKIS
jgi:hypothetical protein